MIISGSAKMAGEHCVGIKHFVLTIPMQIPDAIKTEMVLTVVLVHATAWKTPENINQHGYKYNIW